MTEIELAKKGLISDNVKKAAIQENVAPEQISKSIAAGHTIILKNRCHNVKPVAIGKGLSTKVNANIGTSSDISDINFEIEKAQIAIEAGADTIMDLSTGGNLDIIRRKIMEAANVAIGTVPIYQAASEIAEEKGEIYNMSEDLLFDVIKRHLESGVDYLTVHCGVTWNTINIERKSERIQGVVSKGGSLLASWMVSNNRENPLFENYDRLLSLAKEYDATLSLGDAFRPGAIDDASDRAQISELITLGDLHRRALEYGVQSMIEGPGHIPIDQILPNLKIEKTLCDGAPFYVLGPLVTDVAPGYDHITSAIGGALMAAYGVDFLCYVTPSEHLSLPNKDDVRTGVIAARIAGHAGDIVKGVHGAKAWDKRMSKARKALDWNLMEELAIDPSAVANARSKYPPTDPKSCTMCGKFCAAKILDENLMKT